MKSLELWNIKASFYRGARNLPLIKKILEREIDNLKGLIQRAGPLPEIIVDIGTGAGSTLVLFPGYVKVVGVDISIAMLKRARSIRNIFCVVADSNRLPFKGKFDFISAVGLTEYINDRREFLKEVKSIMRDGARLLITISQPNVYNVLRNLLGSHVHTVSIEDWEAELLDQGFEILERKETMMQVQYLLKCRT